MVIRIDLPTVTLCAAASVNVDATIEALSTCLKQIEFGECLLFTDRVVRPLHPAIRVVPISALKSTKDYSDFLLYRLGDHLRTEHCLIVQWDGFVLDANLWDPTFLQFDYIGAPWPQFQDGHSVGNGGFSLRSRKLLTACRDPRFSGGHPEDVAICRTNRNFLEREFGISFADRGTASRFSFERTDRIEPTFGFHGVFNLIKTSGADRFWQIYGSLDDKHTAFVDYPLLMCQLGTGKDAFKRRLRLTLDRLGDLRRL